MDEMREIQGSMAQMQALFTEQMAKYEGKLQKQSEAPETVASLSNEFSTFKSFVLMAMKGLQHQIQATAQAVDQLEMLSRRKHLLLHGVPEEKKEDTNATVVKVVAGRLKMAGFTSGDINRCHRMGRLTSDRPRPILVKLRDVSVRDGMWFAKTQLKDTGITISEFLTRARHEVFMQARQRFGITKAWTREGYVFVVGPDDIRRRVSSLDELDKISCSQTTSAVRPTTAASSSPAEIPSLAAAARSAAVKEPAALRSRRVVTARK